MYRFWIFCFLAVAIFLGYPILNEDVDSACNALEAKVISLYTASVADKDSNLFRGMITHAVFSSMFDGEVASALAKKTYPNIPPAMGCAAIYWNMHLDPIASQRAIDNMRKRLADPAESSTDINPPARQDWEGGPQMPVNDPAQAERDRELTAALDAEHRQVQQRADAAHYTRTIRQSIEANWVRPPSTERLSCTLEVGLAPGGDVTGVRVLTSSGDLAFDRSVTNAVYKAAPLPVPSGALFEQFRTIRFNFGRPG